VQLNATRADLQAAGLGDRAELRALGRRLPFVGVFSDLPDGGPGAIVDSQGMLAIVVNRGSAAERLGLHPGDALVIE
jgi:S-adenosylmethionine hydrolase